MLFLEFLNPEVVIFCAILVFMFFIVSLTRNRLFVYCLGIPLFMSCFGKYRYITKDFVFPLEWMYLNSRAIYVLLMSAILVIAWIVVKKRVRLRLHPANIFFLLLQYVYAVRMIMVGAEGFGTVTLTVFTLNILVIVVVRSTLSAESSKAAQSVAEMIAIAGAIFTLASLFQFTLDRANSFWGGRFIGITNNSIHTGEYCAWFGLATMAVLFGSKRNLWNLRSLALMALVLLQFLIIIATGSRTAMLLLLVSLIVMFRRRLGSLMIPLILIGVAAAILIEYFEEFTFATQHLTSGSDSRTGVFLYMMERFLQNPFIGTVEILEDQGRLQVRESSYFSAAANLGLLGLIPLFGVLICYFREFAKVAFKSKQQATQTIYQDWLHGMLCGSFVAALFEGFMFQIVAPAPFLIHFGLLLLYNHNLKGKRVARSSPPGSPVESTAALDVPRLPNQPFPVRENRPTPPVRQPNDMNQ